jgi:hypothetical protein
MSRIQPGVFENLVTYFQSHAEQLELEANRARIFQNDPDTGDKREDILHRFLDKHLPDRCDVSNDLELLIIRLSSV